MSVSVDRFIHDGFVRLDGAFPRPLADACRQVLWRATGCNENDPTTWTRPVVRIGGLRGRAGLPQVANQHRVTRARAADAVPLL